CRVAIANNNHLPRLRAVCACRGSGPLQGTTKAQWVRSLQSVGSIQKAMGTRDVPDAAISWICRFDAEVHSGVPIAARSEIRLFTVALRRERQADSGDLPQARSFRDTSGLALPKGVRLQEVQANGG